MPFGGSVVHIAQAADSTAGGTYYVATDGSDSADGSESAPFKTIAKAAEVAEAGDTVIVKGGTYKDHVTFSNSGNQSALITFRAASGERPKITANGSKYAFDFAGQSYISIEGFDISGSQNHLIRLESASSNGNIIANNILHNTSGRGDGVRIMAAKNTQVLNNVMHHVQYGVKVERSNSGGNSAVNTLIKGNEIYKPGVDCIYLAAPGVTVDGNNLHDNNETYSAGEHADGIQVYMKSYTANSKFVFSNNLIDLKDQPDSKRQCNSLMLENAGGITIFNNVINGRNEANGINLKSCPNSKVFNNTVVDTANSTIYVHKGSTAASSNVLIYNNITPGIKVLSDGSKSGSQIGNNLVGKDPQFADKAAGDFKLKSGSPAIDKGYANSDDKLPYPDTCMGGGERIVNGKIDIGAYEFGAKPAEVDDDSETTAEETQTVAEETDESQEEATSDDEQSVNDGDMVTDETDSDTAANNDETLTEDTDSSDTEGIAKDTESTEDTSAASPKTCETCEGSSFTGICEKGSCIEDGGCSKCHSQSCTRYERCKKHSHHKRCHGRHAFKLKNSRELHWGKNKETKEIDDNITDDNTETTSADCSNCTKKGCISCSDCAKTVADSNDDTSAAVSDETTTENTDIAVDSETDSVENAAAENVSLDTAISTDTIDADTADTSTDMNDTGTVDKSADTTTDKAASVDDADDNDNRVSIENLIDFLKRFLSENQSIKKLIVIIRN